MYGFFEVNLLEHKMTPVTPQIVASFFQAVNNCLMSYARAILLFNLLGGGI